jgi:hypothetical protein
MNVLVFRNSELLVVNNEAIEYYHRRTRCSISPFTKFADSRFLRIFWIAWRFIWYVVALSAIGKLACLALSEGGYI